MKKYHFKKSQSLLIIIGRVQKHSTFYHVFSHRNQRFYFFLEFFALSLRKNSNLCIDHVNWDNIKYWVSKKVKYELAMFWTSYHCKIFLKRLHISNSYKFVIQVPKRISFVIAKNAQNKIVKN